MLRYMKFNFNAGWLISLAYLWQLKHRQKNVFFQLCLSQKLNSKLLRSVQQWSCHYMCLRIRSVAAVIRTPNLPLARRMLLPIAPSPRFQYLYVPYNQCLFNLFVNKSYSIFFLVYRLRRQNVYIFSCLKSIKNWLQMSSNSAQSNSTTSLDAALFPTTNAN